MEILKSASGTTIEIVNEFKWHKKFKMVQRMTSETDSWKKWGAFILIERRMQENTKSGGNQSST